MTRPLPRLLTLALLTGCAARSTEGERHASPAPEVGPASPNASAPPTPASSGNEAFAARLDELLAEHLAAHPERAVELGLHAYDGKLPDVSPQGLAGELQRLEHAIADLEAFTPETLSDTQRAERAAMLSTLRVARFDLAGRRRPLRDPMFYLEPLAPTAYIARAYAPLAQRAAAVTALAAAVPAHLAHARTNLETKLPRTFIDTGLLQARGLVSFVQQDVPAAFSELADAQQRAELDRALTEMAKALEGFITDLEARRKLADDRYALGAEGLQAMLAASQGIDIPIAVLREVFQADLERNFAALEAAAKAIEPKRSVASVVGQVLSERPAPDSVLEVAQQQAEQMRAFMVEHDLVTVPQGAEARVVATPPFMRWNVAFLDAAGPFETTPLPSFYYISPPDPKWPKAKQRGYIPATVDLLFITIHEVWPGHFLHTLHIRQNESRALQASWNYVTGEGWAHYTEEMMWDAGVSEDPRVHIGQLVNALLRDVRALSAIGLHTGEMTVEQSKVLFMQKAFQGVTNAEQQAVRGTFDPMYLGYTLGKLMVRKLRDDYFVAERAAGREPSLRAFHDEVLSYGGTPLPAIRELMLGPSTGPAL